jgi:hypothetical protein
MSVAAKEVIGYLYFIPISRIADAVMPSSLFATFLEMLRRGG